MKERAVDKVSTEFLSEAERIRLVSLKISKDQARKLLYLNEEHMRRGREFFGMSQATFDLFVETVVRVMFPEDGRLSDEQIEARGFKVDTVRGKARSTKGMISQNANNGRFTGGSSPFMQRTGINRNREGIK